MWRCFGSATFVYGRRSDSETTTSEVRSLRFDLRGLASEVRLADPYIAVVVD